MSGAESVGDRAGPVLPDLHLAQAGALGHDVGGEEDAGHEPAVGADEEVRHAPRYALQARQAAAARAGAVRPRSHVADAVADQGHRAVEEVRHQHRAHLPRRGRPFRRLDFHA